eukprot:TRINITY_DN6214_c0_g1_i1.p1 TRINITY_DN6214_c0_g1~~TRINITY_DN6214_c0_g1_i1.p1  ORF type:complete len:452 (+),score=63.56 TRINITY_DN6214_c0_g1_i1:71-1426(+)
MVPRLGAMTMPLVGCIAIFLLPDVAAADEIFDMPLIGPAADAVMLFFKTVSKAGSLLYAYSILGVVVLALFLTRPYWAPQVYEATIGQLHLPSFTNAHCCCIHFGYWIQDIWCPCICPSFHPPFGLRLIVVKARHLPESVADMAGAAPMEVYVEAEAGNNPKKSTSAQRYKPTIWDMGDNKLITYLNPGTDTVVFNEPLHVQVPPSLGNITLNIYKKTFTGQAELLCTRTVEVDSFYEPPGMCFRAQCCGWFPLAKWIAFLPFLGQVYKYPFIRGAPRSHVEKERLVKKELRKLAGFIPQQQQMDATMPLVSELKTEEEAQGLSPEEIRKEVAKATEIVHDNWTLIKQLPAWLADNTEVAVAAVTEDNEAYKFCGKNAQQDEAVLSAAYGVPRPMVLQMFRKGLPAGKLWVYFVMHDIDESLPGWNASKTAQANIQEEQAQAFHHSKVSPV